MALNFQPAPRQGNTRSWKPGQSGNPKGRPLAPEQSLQALCRAHTAEAVKTLIVALHHPRERVTAAIAILDRGWGKPMQNVHVQSEQTVLHLIAAQTISQELASLAQPAPTIEAQVEAGEVPTE